MNLTKRAIASRANGAKSRGPVSSAGKLRSSQNALRHGLLAQCIVLKDDECGDTFKKVLDYHVAKFKPADDVEFGIVEDMVAAQWRMRRAWTIESTLFDTTLAKRTEPKGALRVAAAFAELADGNQLKLLDRYESRLHRMYQRSRKTLLEMQQLELDEEDAELPNEPNEPDPIAEDAPLPNEPGPAPEPEVAQSPNEPSSPAPDAEIGQIPNQPDSVDSATPNEPNEDDEEDDDDEDDDDDDDPVPAVLIGGTVYKILNLPPNIRIKR
jgi:hypothetical protein